MEMSDLSFLTSTHRKKVRHFDLPGDAHFLTFSCYRRLALLAKDRSRSWFVDSLQNAREKHGFQLWAWVIMPEHVHLLIYPCELEHDTATILTAIKRPVGERAIAFLTSQNSQFLERLTVRTRNRTYRRFWQAGPGQDHNIYEPETALRVVDYIHNNPVRRGLVERPQDWPWSSARDWSGEIDVPIKVDRSLPAIVEIPSVG